MKLIDQRNVSKKATEDYPACVAIAYEPGTLIQGAVVYHGGVHCSVAASIDRSLTSVAQGIDHELECRGRLALVWVE